MAPTITNLSGFETLTPVSPTALYSYCTVTFCKTLTTTIRFLVHSPIKSNLHILTYILIIVELTFNVLLDDTEVTNAFNLDPDFSIPENLQESSLNHRCKFFTKNLEKLPTKTVVIPSN